MIHGTRDGWVWIAKKPCGKVSAVANDTLGDAAATSAMLRRWLDRGDSICRIPKSQRIGPAVCSPGEPCVCRDCGYTADRQRALFPGQKDR